MAAAPDSPTTFFTLRCDRSEPRSVGGLRGRQRRHLRL